MSIYGDYRWQQWTSWHLELGRSVVVVWGRKDTVNSATHWIIWEWVRVTNGKLFVSTLMNNLYMHTHNIQSWTHKCVKYYIPVAILFSELSCLEHNVTFSVKNEKLYCSMLNDSCWWLLQFKFLKFHTIIMNSKFKFLILWNQLLQHLLDCWSLFMV